MNPRLVPTSRLARSVLRTQTDERLTALARHGSDAAFEALVARYRRSMVRHCGRVVAHADAEEAVQNALISAHAALARGDEVRNVGSWLHAIAYNAALTIVRSRSSRRDGTELDPEQLDHEDAAAERREQLREVVDALQELPLRQREAIVMRELEGRSYEEIAARMDSSAGAVRQLLNRARTTMRDKIGALAPLEPLLRWLGDHAPSGSAVARIGALASGCAVTAKLCATALIPATIVAVAPTITTRPQRKPQTHRARAHTTAPPRESVKTIARTATIARTTTIATPVTTPTPSRTTTTRFVSTAASTTRTASPKTPQPTTRETTRSCPPPQTQLTTQDPPPQQTQPQQPTPTQQQPASPLPQ